MYDLLGWHQPYPTGEFIPYWRHTRAEPQRWLSTQEFFDFLGVLPTETAFRLDPASSREAVKGWLKGNPGREEDFPIPTILWELDRITGPAPEVVSPPRLDSRSEAGGSGGG